MLRYYPAKEVRKAYSSAYRSLWRAKFRFAKAELGLLMGRNPNADQLHSWAIHGPKFFGNAHIRREIQQHRKDRKARWLAGEPMPCGGYYRGTPSAPKINESQQPKPFSN